MQAAKFLGKRIQGTESECGGRQPDMSAASADAMRTVLGHIEAASKLLSNRETVVKDITNQGPRGVKGGVLSQTHLKRMDVKHQDSVDEMVREVASRLLGKGAQLTTMGDIERASAKALVWAEAAKFLGARIQDPTSEDNEPPHQERAADMSMAAAKALKTVLGQMEAAHMLITNREMVVNDITNSGSAGLKGGKLTQLNLTRVPSNKKAAVDGMIKSVACRLLGQDVSGPASLDDALVWADAAVFFSGRIQSSAMEMPGRPADMGRNAAMALRAVLADFEAAGKLINNRETVVKDITNSGGTAVKGGSLTQTDLKRVPSSEQASVDAMVQEICSRLLGKKMREPQPSWEAAATFFNGRIQSSSFECPGRSPDMSGPAAKAMRAVLAKITSQSDRVDPSSKEAAQMLMFNAERVVSDITNPGPKKH